MEFLVSALFFFMWGKVEQKELCKKDPVKYECVKGK